MVMKPFMTHQILNGINDSGVTLGEYNLDRYRYGASELSDNISNETKNMIFGKNENFYYWLASRGVCVSSEIVYFGLGHVDYGHVDSFFKMYTSHNSKSLGMLSLRPLISLTEEIPTNGNVLDFTDGAETSATQIFITDGNGTITGLTNMGKTLTTIVIPEEINGEKITALDFYIPNSCISLTIPKTITKIRTNAFTSLYKTDINFLGTINECWSSGIARLLHSYLHYINFNIIHCTDGDIII